MNQTHIIIQNVKIWRFSLSNRACIHYFRSSFAVCMSRFRIKGFKTTVIILGKKENVVISNQYEKSCRMHQCHRSNLALSCQIGATIIMLQLTSMYIIFNVYRIYDFVKFSLKYSKIFTYFFLIVKFISKYQILQGILIYIQILHNHR